MVISQLHHRACPAVSSMSSKYDSNAVVTLKDGTIRVGPWKDNKPVGDWYEHPLASEHGEP